MGRASFAVAVAFSCGFAACGGGDPAPAVVRATPRVDASAAPDPARIVGVVEAPDGTPATDAVVAINDVKGKVMAIVRVDGSGRFLAPRPTERFAVTATSTRGTASYAAPADATRTAPLRLHLRRSEEGLTIEGTISVRPGAMPEGTFVGAARSSDDEGDIFYASPSPSGGFTLRVPPGRYWLIAGSDRLITRSIQAGGAAGERAQVDIHASLRAPAPVEVVRWLADRALPIATTELQPASDDIEPLAKLLASARIIGVGEATHGTREYFRLKHRLLERLVAHHDMTLLAMEANFSDAERVDAWLQTGEGSVEDAMKGLLGVWRTEEVREMLVWMRAWNADPKHKKKLRLRGYDVQGTRAPIAALRAYLRKVDRPAETELLGPLAALDADTNGRGTIDLGDAQAIELRGAVTRLLERLAGARSTYVARTSAAAYELVLQHARVLEQALARFAAKGPSEQFTARDRAMAENVAWLSRQIGKDERMMVWAHNGHIQADSTGLLGVNMGTRLREQLGADYVAAGFVLDEGTYRAWVKPNEPTVTDVTVGPREDGWAAEAFARVAVPIFAVDLRDAPAGPVRDWLFAPHILHSCGWLVSEAERKGGVGVLGEAFDVAIYVGRTTSARQLPRRP